MVTLRGVKTGVLYSGLCLAGIAHAMDCSGLPTSFSGNEFPTGDFFTNFNNPCYTVALGRSTGGSNYGDRNATYFQMYFEVNPRYQLVIVGTFPNARYFSIALYDAHSAFSQSILDSDIVPLTATDINPYQPGTPYIAGQQYAVPVNFGGAAGTIETGCMMKGYNAAINTLDATLRHAGMDWNTDKGVFQAYPNFATHIVDTPQHTNPNTAGVIMIRSYLDTSPSGYSASPHIIVRDVASGCAYPAAYVLSNLQNVIGSASTGSSWLDANQGNAHTFYETTYLPKLCYGSDSPQNMLPWTRQQEYVAGASPDAAYEVANVPPGLPATLAAAGEVMRIRFQLPTTPPTPCTNGCSRSGTEQLRYMSLSFLDPGGVTIASLADSAFTKGANNDVTLIVGTGSRIPSWITPANGYTFLDLSTLPGYQQLNLLDLRQLIPAGSFNCAGQFVPYRTTVSTPAGSLMGPYTPIVDYPVASSLGPVAAPFQGPSACDVFPVGQPGTLPNCGVFKAPPPQITSVVTQCAAPGCTQFAAQADPPVTIVGGGFGNFPSGMPYVGISRYLQIVDITQNWTAGFTGSACNISLTSWATNRIQLVASVEQSDACPLVAGDQLNIQVWNPQTMVSGTFRVTAVAN